MGAFTCTTIGDQIWKDGSIGEQSINTSGTETRKNENNHKENARME